MYMSRALHENPKLMPTTIERAFAAWTAKHAELLAGERSLAQASLEYAQGQESEPVELKVRVARLREEADRLLAQAVLAMKQKSADESGAPERGRGAILPSAPLRKEH